VVFHFVSSVVYGCMSYLRFPYGFLYLFVAVLLRWFEVAKIRLFVRTRRNNKGSYIASVPLKRLKRLAECRKRRWMFKDGWLILEAF